MLIFFVLEVIYFNIFISAVKSGSMSFKTKFKISRRRDPEFFYTALTIVGATFLVILVLLGYNFFKRFS